MVKDDLKSMGLGILHLKAKINFIKYQIFGVGALIIGLVILRNEFTNDFIDNEKLLAGLLFVGVGLFSIVAKFLVTNFIFDGEVLKSYSGLGLTNKTVNFQNINGYYERTQFERKKLYIIYNQNQKLIISSDYTNYEIFKSLIEKHKKLIPPLKIK